MIPIRDHAARFRGLPLGTMAIWLALIATIFLTRDRWDAWVDAEELPELAGSPIDVSADRARALFMLKDRMELWDLDALRRLATYDGEAGHSEFGFAPGGSRALIVRGHCEQSNARIVDAAFVVDAEDGRTLFTLTPGARPTGARLSFDKAWLVLTYEDGSATVRSALDGEALTTLEGPFGSWPRVWVSPDRRTDGELVWSFSVARPGPDLHFDQSTRLLFHGKLSDWGELLDLSTGARLVRWPCLGFVNPGGVRIFAMAVDEGALKILKLSSGGTVASIPRVASWTVVDDETVIAGDYGEPGRVVRRIRPEEWWGVFYLWHFYVIAGLTVALVVSIWRDQRALRRSAGHLS